MTELKIEQWPIDRFTPYARNPRRNDDAVPKMAGLIKEFGFKVPIVARSDGEVIDGHLRLKAARHLGLETVPVVLADDWTPAQVKAFRLAVNKSAEWAEWDEDLLKLEIEDLKLEDFDLELIGFDEISLDGEGTEGLTDPDEVPEVQETPVSKLGDIWLLGNHRLMCGDSTDAGSVTLLLANNKIQLALTDPPYGINAVKITGGGMGTIGTGNWPRERGKAGGGGTLRFKLPGHNRRSEPNPFPDGWGDSSSTPEKNQISPGAVVPAHMYLPVKGDESTDTAKIYWEISRELVEHQIIFGGNYFTDFLPPSRCWVVWNKHNTGNFADAELAWTDFDRGVKLYDFTWNGLQREGSRDVEGVHRVHPTQKPVGMIGEIIRDFCPEKGSVLDCFGGSGSTLIACEQTARTCFMMEYEAGYVDVIVRRWQDFTGKEATLEASGKTFAQVQEERG